MISATCAALTGILLPMYLGEVTTFTGRGMEFQAVAAVVIGGTSLFGGRGNVLPGTLAGAMLLIIINNGLGTRGVSPVRLSIRRWRRNLSGHLSRLAEEPQKIDALRVAIGHADAETFNQC